MKGIYIMFSLQKVKYKEILNVESLTIPDGKTTCIVGESGSGKTTLLRLLNNMISCDEGDITFKGTPLYNIDPVQLRRNVVMLPQAPVIFNGTVRDNLLIGLYFSEKPAVNDSKLYGALQMVNLNKKLDDNPEKLSGGEKQRLALARVILMEPEVFLLDEPSSSLDESTEQLIIEKLSEYCKEAGKTLVMVTHSPKLAEYFSNIVIRISNGRITEQKEVQNAGNN